MRGPRDVLGCPIWMARYHPRSLKNTLQDNTQHTKSTTVQLVFSLTGFDSSRQENMSLFVCTNKTIESKPLKFIRCTSPRYGWF